MKLFFKIVVVVTVVSSWLLTSCDTSEELTAAKEPPPALTPPPSAIDVPLWCRRGGNCEKFFGPGWSDPEDQFTWTTAKRATLLLPIGDESGNVTLRMRLLPMRKLPEIASQRVGVVANGRRIAEWAVADLGDYDAAIPADVVRAGRGVVTVELELPDAASPRQLGTGDDARELGVGCYSVLLSSEQRDGEQAYSLGR